MNQFICVCGREFQNVRAFNGHKSKCKQHHLQKYGNLDVLLNANRETAIKSANSRKQNEIKKKQEKEQQWVQEQHTCEHCGKIMTYKFGCGRFCSRQCANSHVQSVETNQKRSDALKGNIAFSKGEKVIYVKPDQLDQVPEGYVRGNGFLIKKHADYRKEHNITTRVRQSDKSKPISYEKLLQQCQPLIEAHNQSVLQQYDNLLSEKTQDKVFTITESITLFCGYQAIRNSTHLRAKSHRLFVHVLLGECLLDRPLTPDEVVHHKNADKLDNRLDNIYIFDNKASHSRFHYNKSAWIEIHGDVLSCKKLTKSDLLALIQNI